MAASRRPIRDAGRILRQPYYLLRPRLWSERLDIVDSRTLVSRRARYVYLRIPKAANSTVVRALLDHFPEPGFPAADPERAKTGMPHLGDTGLGDLAPLKRFFVFTVVRNPYARTLSAYLDKFRQGDKHLDRLGERVAGFNADRLTFRGFCRYLAAGGEAENAHWMRQTRLTGLADRIDFVGRVETLEADLATILHGIGARKIGRIESAGPPATEAAAKSRAHYDDETRGIVETVYRRDFEAFGYRIGDV